MVHVPIICHLDDEIGESRLEEFKVGAQIELMRDTRRNVTQPISKAPPNPISRGERNTNLTVTSSQYGEVKSSRMQEQGGKKITAGDS